jgi:putative colanic acid biosysnthesis UDP-glucose lipid carrier transferase
LVFINEATFWDQLSILVSNALLGKPQFPFTLNSAVRHTTIEPRVTGIIQDSHPNEPISPFVASRKNYLLFKRGFDIIASLIVIAGLLSWIFPLVALIIKIDSRGPVLFRQRRVGKNGRIFYCTKFRTMRENAEADERPASQNDDRITVVGKILRSTNLDELPQFLNVLIGQMSVIGPRPHMITDCIRFSFVIPAYSLRSLVRPGITGWAQVNGYHGPTKDYSSIINRYNWDALYVRRMCFALDAMIIFKTIARVARNFTNLAFRK